MEWTLRHAIPGDGPHLRELRFQALRGDGAAFLETLTAASELDDMAWETRVARYCRPGRQVLAVAEGRTGRWLGMAGAFIDDERDSDEFVLPDPPVGAGERWAMVWATYVAPGLRGRKIADSLYTELCRWAAHDAGVDWLGLHFRDTNTAAIDVYPRHRCRIVGHSDHPELGVSSLITARPTDRHSRQQICPRPVSGR